MLLICWNFIERTAFLPAYACGLVNIVDRTGWLEACVWHFVQWLISSMSLRLANATLEPLYTCNLRICMLSVLIFYDVQSQNASAKVCTVCTHQQLGTCMCKGLIMRLKRHMQSCIVLQPSLTTSGRPPRRVA